ncbi:hypothetical protein PAXRUDRAFT_827137 [Paxillus rubicundulus Ve08.2h10]|uniref:Uncharacterized protein n=1 Tax=Paxillus rubicundulus Ve08.2h10 TaxID=930991 RepID=A0A0D0E3A6_9AGAM|nr:hypothetical protein PAXRUDRAFT_827137 [Paxillus rubicundulus Ve08.2h10]
MGPFFPQQLFPPSPVPLLRNLVVPAKIAIKKEHLEALPQPRAFHPGPRTQRSFLAGC